MYHGLPVIAYGVSYNRTTTEHKAIYFRDAEELVEIVKNLDIKTMKDAGKTMREIAERRYTWKIVADKYDQLVQECYLSNKKSSVHANLSGLSENTLMEYNAAHLKHPTLFYQK